MFDATVQAINVSHSTISRTKKSFNAASTRCLPLPRYQVGFAEPSAWKLRVFHSETQVALERGLHRSVLSPRHR